jgi:hypothetical protein
VAPALGVTAVDAALLAWAMGSVHALLDHRRALALLALWAVGGIALALLRPLRGHDAVQVERESPLVMLLLLLIPLSTPPLSALGEHYVQVRARGALYALRTELGHEQLFMLPGSVQ